MSMTPASAEYFDRNASQWDHLRAGYFGDALRSAVIAKSYLRADAVVADIGTGTGFMAAGLAPLVSQIYAVDGSEAMLAVARQNLAGQDNIVFQVADGVSLPFDDGAVDVAFANMYLHHCPDPRAAIEEMVRILKPGGRLVISDMEAHDHGWLREEMADEWLGFDRQQVKAWLREAGLVNVVVDCDGQSCCATSQDAGQETAEIDVFIASGSKRVSGVREAVQANYGALAEEQSGGCCGAPPAAEDRGCCGTAPASGCCTGANAMELIESVHTGEILLWETGYDRSQLAEVPAEAASFTLGCGNPTAMASLRPGEVVLDIGSGGGVDAFFAARRVGPSGRVIGLDMTPAMIQRARAAAEREGISQVEFRLGQAEDMPVENGTVDVVLSNCVINLCEDKGRVFEEAYRVLKIGGRLSISDMVSDRSLPAEWRSDSARWAGCVHGALPEAEYLDLVKQAGFTEITAQRSLSGGEVEGVQVYSLSVSARKSQAGVSNCCG